MLEPKVNRNTNCGPSLTVLFNFILINIMIIIVKNKSLAGYHSVDHIHIIDICYVHLITRLFCSFSCYHSVILIVILTVTYKD